MAKPKLLPKPNNAEETAKDISPISQELVIGVVGYAGAGCSTAARRIRVLLELKGYEVHPIKLSTLIAERFDTSKLQKIEEGARKGVSQLLRASELQDRGDNLRKQYGNAAVAALAVHAIKKQRGSRIAGEQKLAFILDSIKHSEEVELLRRAYDLSFRLVAVHCEQSQREKRLIGDARSTAKYSGALRKDVHAYMDRDEKDRGRQYGQQVRDAFYRADFFIDNNSVSRDGENLTHDLSRLVDLLLGSGLVRPTREERAMYHAHAAALQSSCLSRQVGAALMLQDGTIVSTGTNEVPKFGGGVCDEDAASEHRCFQWKWTDGSTEFVGCHNKRKKDSLQKEIGEWLATNLSEKLARAAYPPPEAEFDIAEKARSQAKERIADFFRSDSAALDGAPGLKDAIEYSRAIHAEMSALLSAARNRISPEGAALFCTTYPCHNCARHLVTAGIEYVYYIEPYVKSLARELHGDSISTEFPPVDATGARSRPTKMVIVPFTGVGPRMYEDFFTKRVELKFPDGSFDSPVGGVPALAVRLRELLKVEDGAAALVPEK
ncbi:anti-phage dCTP deaminase [Rhizomicrobium palustre]